LGFKKRSTSGPDPSPAPAPVAAPPAAVATTDKRTESMVAALALTIRAIVDALADQNVASMAQARGWLSTYGRAADGILETNGDRRGQPRAASPRRECPEGRR